MRLTFTKWAVTCDFQRCGILTSVYSDEPVQPPFKHRNSKWCSVSSLTLIDIQATNKGSDQTVRFSRLIWGLAGRTYHIVGNPMPRLKCRFVYLYYFARPAYLLTEIMQTSLEKCVPIDPTCVWQIPFSALWTQRYVEGGQLSQGKYYC